MADNIKIVYEGGKGEIVEKKSRFIGEVWPIDTEEDAIRIIEATKKKYWDARHNCSAFVIGENNDIQRYSDDGEPQGTAGKPMLSVLLNEGMHDCLVIVTRYFGGILLGTGGLVRAYQQAAKVALDNAKVVEKQKGASYKVTTDYNGIGKLQYIAAQNNITIMDTEYSDIVIAHCLLKTEDLNAFEKKMTEATNGKVTIEKEEDMEFAVSDGDIIVF